METGRSETLGTLGACPGEPGPGTRKTPSGADNHSCPGQNVPLPRDEGTWVCLLSLLFDFSLISLALTLGSAAAGHERATSVTRPIRHAFLSGANAREPAEAAGLAPRVLHGQARAQRNGKANDPDAPGCVQSFGEPVFPLSATADSLHWEADDIRLAWEAIINSGHARCACQSQAIFSSIWQRSAGVTV